MLRFTDLGFAYQPGHWVIRGVSGVVDAGRALAILGPNGRGKSTLLKLLTGALKAQEGEVHVDGVTAYVPQLFDAAFDYSVLDMVVMGRARRIGILNQPSLHDVQAAHVALDRLGIADLAARRFLSLSGGQRQLVILARALVSEAGVLLLDEPTSALDFHNQAVVLGWIRRLAHVSRLAVVFTTHSPHHALVAATEAMLLFEGEAPLVGPAREVLTAEPLSRLYGHPIVRMPITGGDEAWQDIIAPRL